MICINILWMEYTDAAFNAVECVLTFVVMCAFSFIMLYVDVMNVLSSQVKVKVTLWLIVSQSWCWAPFWINDQILLTVWQLLSCHCEVPSLTRGQVCLLSVTVYRNMSAVILYNIFIFYMLYMLITVCTYYIYKASVSPGSGSQIMPYF
jgi:hypothetical protein